MANIAIFRINYKSDFILTLNSDAGWMTPFCIKFWTGAPSQAYFVGYDGTTYTHCAPVDGEPTKLLVQFDDHHLPIGDLKFQIGYHFTVADFPNDVEDEVLNQASVIIEQDGEPAQVMLDFTGETAPEIQFSLPAYANEAQRIANEQQRIAAETQRIANEETRIANEQTRINQEQTRQQNEQQRINQEQARVNEYAGLKADAVAATGAANDAAALANQKAQLAADKAALAQSAAQLANDKAQLAADKAALAQAASQLCDEKAALAQQKATYAQQQGDYSKAQGDYAKEQGDYSKEQGDYSKEQGDYSKEQGDYAKDKGDICAEDHQTAVADHQTAVADHQTAQSDHGIAADDHTQAGNDHTRAESDHTRAESDHAAVEVYVDSLGVFDLSKHNAVGGVLATYADLSAALTALNALDSKYKYGGMSFKFVQSSDNKYVQFRYMGTATTGSPNPFLDTANWQGVDDEPTAGSENLVKSGGVSKHTWVNKFVGANDTFIDKVHILGTIPGHHYRVYLQNPNFDRTGVTSSGYKFLIRYKPIGSATLQVLAGSQGSQEVRSYYDFTLPNEQIEYLEIGGRATSGVEVFFILVDRDLSTIIEDNSVTFQKLASSLVAQTLSNDNNKLPSSKAVKDVLDHVTDVTQNLENSIDEITGVTQNYESGYWSQGGVAKEDVDYIRGLDYIPVQSTDTIKWCYANNESNASIGCPFYDSSKNFIISALASDASGVRKITLSSYPTVAYIRASFFANYKSNAKIEVNDVVVWTAIDGISTDYLRAIEQNFTDAQKVTLQKNTGVYQPLITLQNDVGDLVGKQTDFRLRNGSQGNPGNTYVILMYGLDDSHLAIPVTPGQKYKLKINKTPTEGYQFFYCIVTYTTATPSTQTSNVRRNEGGSAATVSAHTLDEIITINSSELGLALQISEAQYRYAYPQSDYNIPLRITDFEPGDIELVNISNSDLQKLQDEIDSIKSGIGDVYTRNIDKTPMLVNACRKGKTSNTSKDIQLLICTDSHSWALGIENAIRAANLFQTIDAFVHCGDITASYYNADNISAFHQQINALVKPGYFVCGNHDVGQAYYVGLCCNHEQAYNSFIKPMVDKGWLVSGEYTANKPYWYHDFSTYKIRLIGVYEYDDNLDFNETYWKAIVYDNSLSDIELNTSYNQGDKVNVPGFTAYSFEAVQTVTTPTSYYTTPQYLPSYKVLRGTRVIRQTQAQWLLDVLASTPVDYGVIIMMHNPFSVNAVSTNNKFSWKSGVSASQWSQNSMQTDFIRNAVVAFIDGTDYSEKVVMSGNASYLNTLNDGSIDYAYEVSKNFSTKNSGVFFIGFLGGHSHQDFIWKDALKNVYQVSPTCAVAVGANSRFGDIRRITTDGLAVDSITVFSGAEERMALVKLGVNATDEGKFRNYEVINTNV